MKSINEYNKIWDVTKSIGKWISEQELQILMADGRVFTTRRHMYEWEATNIIGPAPENYPYSHEGVYSGTIITTKGNDWDEAQKIANERGWGEEVDGVLCDIVSCDAPMNLYQPNSN